MLTMNIFGIIGKNNMDSETHKKLLQIGFDMDRFGKELSDFGFTYKQIADVERIMSKSFQKIETTPTINPVKDESSSDFHKKICDELNELYRRKNNDYGDSFHKTFIEEGMAMVRIRLSDKLNRLKYLTKKKRHQEVSDESIRDTLMDLANYTIMSIMEIDNGNIEN